MYVYYNQNTGRIVADAQSPLPLAFPHIEVMDYIPFVGTTYYVLNGELALQPNPVPRPPIGLA